MFRVPIEWVFSLYLKAGIGSRMNTILQFLVGWFKWDEKRKDTANEHYS